jgi:putative flippase GtrA
MGSLYVLNITFGLSSLIAVAFSFWIGFIVAFILQKWIAFKNHDRAARTVTKQLIAYSLLASWNYAFTLGAVALFSPTTSVFIIRTITIMVITMWNFALYRIIFRELSTKYKIE